MLVALYEHKIFTQGIVWNIYQLRPVGRRARQAARQEDRARARRRAGAVTTHDASTNGLINRYKSRRGSAR